MTTKWFGHPFLYPHRPIEAKQSKPLACRHDPCWCGRIPPRHEFDPWTPEGEKAFLERRLVTRPTGKFGEVEVFFGARS